MAETNQSEEEDPLIKAGAELILKTRMKEKDTYYMKSVEVPTYAIIARDGDMIYIYDIKDLDVNDMNTLAREMIEES